MDMHEPDEAAIALRRREGIPDSNKNGIGRWQTGEDAPALIVDLPSWTAAHSVDAVIWTALPAKSPSNPKVPPDEREVVEYLRNLDRRLREDVEGYVRRAPPQIDTKIRRRIEAEMGWHPKKGS